MHDLACYSLTVARALLRAALASCRRMVLAHESIFTVACDTASVEMRSSREYAPARTSMPRSARYPSRSRRAVRCRTYADPRTNQKPRVEACARPDASTANPDYECDGRRR